MSPNDSPLPDSGGPDHRQASGLPIESGKPAVPAFGCIVYVSSAGGGVRGRVANLGGIQLQAADERQLLGQIVAQFKSEVARCLAEGQTPNWIDPPEAKRDDERKLFLPVHL